MKLCDKFAPQFRDIKWMFHKLKGNRELYLEYLKEHHNLVEVPYEMYGKIYTLYRCVYDPWFYIGVSWLADGFIEVFDAERVEGPYDFIEEWDYPHQEFISYPYYGLDVPPEYQPD